ncbi:MAG: C-GCAxxG-C-C family protein [Solidesulfovibrio sp.]
MVLNRRAMLGTLGGLVVGGALAATVGPVAAAPFDQTSAPFGWTPHKLDPIPCAKVAYDGYWFNDYGCCYGSFYAIIGTMAEKFGAPYNQFPFTMMEVGKSGISEWGTICGALLGVASAYSLFWGRKERNPMVSELFSWYEKTAFPMFDPGDAAKGVKGALPTCQSDSVLCHISVSRWCHVSKLAQSSKERSERCSRITADVAAKGIAILNAKIDGTFKPTGKSESVAYCGECHDKGKQADNAKGLMDCKPCHGGSEHVQDKFKNHP